VSASGTITYRTSADGFGDLATDEDRDSFCAFVERRLEETYPGYTCDALWGGDALESVVTVDSDDEDAPKAAELRSWIGNELWDEWCRADGSHRVQS
jgi:hypothetical protein